MGASFFVYTKSTRNSNLAGIETLGGYSAHSDQQGLIDFVTGMEQWPKRLRLIHGEAGAKWALAEQLEGFYRERAGGVRLEI
jgi:metallo-beta-lactamase family protein